MKRTQKTNPTPNQVRRSVYRRDGFRCALCDSTDGIQIHHVVPRSEGGSPDSAENMITLCRRCHSAIHGKPLDDLPAYVNPEYLQQAAVEYMSDLYAEEEGRPWNPWNPNRGRWREEWLEETLDELRKE